MLSEKKERKGKLLFENLESTNTFMVLESRAVVYYAQMTVEVGLGNKRGGKTLVYFQETELLKGLKF